MNLNLALDALPPDTRPVLDLMNAQMGVQWGVSHTPDGKLKRRLLSAFNSTTQTLGDSTWTAMTFNGEDDWRGVATVTPVPSIVHSKTVRADRFIITPDLAGRARIRVRLVFGIDADGDRAMALYKNDAVYRYGTIVKAAAAVSTIIESVFDIRTVAGEAYSIYGWHSAGGNLDLGSTTRALANEITWEFL